MSRRVTKQNNRSFKESFNHVEPYIMSLKFTEPFNHIEPPAMSLDFTEPFDA